MIRCHCIDILRHCEDIMCPLGRSYFLKKVVPSCLESEITHRFSKTYENTFEELQFSEATGLQLKIGSFIDMKQRFQRRIHKNVDGC